MNTIGISKGIFQDIDNCEMFSTLIFLFFNKTYYNTLNCTHYSQDIPKIYLLIVKNKNCEVF